MKIIKIYDTKTTFNEINFIFTPVSDDNFVRDPRPKLQDGGKFPARRTFERTEKAIKSRRVERRAEEKLKISRDEECEKFSRSSFALLCAPRFGFVCLRRRRLHRRQARAICSSTQDASRFMSQ
jgi:hypothetical protein